MIGWAVAIGGLAWLLALAKAFYGEPERVGANERRQILLASVAAGTSALLVWLGSFTQLAVWLIATLIGTWFVRRRARASQSSSD